MHRENKLENISEGKQTDPLLKGQDPAVGSGYRTASGIIIDFHSDEFNHRDDLDDLSGNYRTFQPLDGVVTADMLHQVERRGRAVDAATSNTPAVKSNDLPAKEAGASAEGLPITLNSRGRILIIDTDATRARTWGKTLNAEGMTCTAVVTGRKTRDISCSRSDGLPLLEVPDLTVTGSFGSFSAMTSASGSPKPLADWLDAEVAAFDLVLDLQPAASYVRRSVPLGYYAPGPNPDHPEEILTELPQMRGQFQKPQFTTFRQNLCLHHLSRKKDICRRCLDVCPLSAIQSIKGQLIFNYHICQGCGACALVCPTEAVRIAYPSQQERLSALRESIVRQSDPMKLASTLIITDDDRNNDSFRPTDKADDEHRIYFAIDEIGHVGAELMLLALVYGATQVIVACDPQNDPAVADAVRRQAQLGRAILRGLGQPEDRIRFTLAAETGPWDEFDGGLPFDGSRLSQDVLLGSNSRRALIRMAAQELGNQLDAKHPALPLPEESPFGAVLIDSACTLCMACVDACPSEALRAGGGAPKLEFIESHCHQCGLCKDICPEKAIHLQPRMLCDPEKAETPVVLHEVQAARCIECGAPFASQAMVDRIQTNLAGHWMYVSERQLRRLQMCRTCRTRDALMSEDIKIWNPSHVR